MAGAERFAENLAALAARNPALAQRLRATGPGSVSVVSRGRWPNLFDALRQRAVHPEDNPLQEMREVVTALRPAPLFIVIGAGAGYHLVGLQQRFPQVPLVIIEPRADILARALGVTDLRAVLARRDVTVIVADDPDAAAAQVTETQDLDALPLAAFVPLQGADALYPGFLPVFRERLAERITVEQRTRATLLLFAPRWQQHFWASLPDILRLPPVTRLDRSARGRPAFVVGGGPSLDGNGALLAQAAGRGVVIAVDTALPPLRRLGVTPDIAVTLDAGWGNAQSLLGEFAGTAGLLAAFPLVAPEVLRAWAGKTVAFNLRHPALQALSALREPIADLRVSGSVVTAAYDLARRMGCDPVVLVGVDLVLDGQRMYTRGARLYDGWRAQASRYATVEMAGRTLYHGLDLASAESTRQMGYWRHWLEREAAAWRGRTLNACPPGAGPGTLPRVALADVLRRELPKPGGDWRVTVDLHAAVPDAPAAAACWAQLRDEVRQARDLLAAGTPAGELAALPRLGELCRWDIKVAKWQATPAQQRQTAEEMLATVARGLDRLAVPA